MGQDEKVGLTERVRPALPYIHLVYTSMRKNIGLCRVLNGNLAEEK